MALDADTVLILKRHVACQDADKERLGSDWVDSDLLFTQPDGSPLHPADVGDAFRELVRLAGLPPVTLHGLRHGAATMALAAGVDIKVVQHMLRHSSITVTMDLYTNVLSEVALAAAEAIAGIIPRRPLHSSRTLGLSSGSQETTMDSQEAAETSPETTNPQVTMLGDLGCGGAPSGT